MITDFFAQYYTISRESHTHLAYSKSFTVILQARNNTLAIEDMDGGTFTISNGGVFGSMLGTPIINPPQSAILGMHAIKDRAVVVNGKVSRIILHFY